MPKTFSEKKPKEISFLYQGEHIIPRDIFNIFYRGLEDLIQINIRAVQKKDIRRSPTSRKYLDPRMQDEANEHIKNWMKEFPKEEAIAEVTFSDKTRMTYSLKKRTNFDLTLLTKPSIIYMNGKDESRAVLREARTYNPQEWVSKLGCRRFEKAFDIQASEQFYFSDKPEIAELPKDSNSVVYIPEPQLLLALEKLYESSFPKITPRITLVDATDKDLWYVRSLLPTLVNSEFDIKKLAKYYGSCHALGLMEMLDRQLIHYCMSKNRVVNYDPDVMTHTRKVNLLTQKDVDEFFTILEEESKIYNVHVFEDDKKEFRKLSEKVRLGLGNAGFTQGLLFSKLKKTIDLAEIKQDLILTK